MILDTASATHFFILANTTNQILTTSFLSPTSMEQKGELLYHFVSGESFPDVMPTRDHELTSQSLAIRRKEIERTRRRNNQRRYRQRQLDLMLRLELNTKQLRDEIEQLKREWTLVSTAAPARKRLWNIVVGYFRLFRHGVQHLEQSTTSATQRRDQLDFVQTTIKQDLVFNAELGADALMRSWMCFSLQFKDFKVKLEGLKKQSRRSMVATTTTSFTITERTLRNVFPHLCRNGREPIDRDMRELFELGDELLGSQIVLRGSTSISWDTKSAQVTSITSTSDMFTVMLQILGNLEKTEPFQLLQPTYPKEFAMNIATLYPPNSQQRSENVIAGVVLRRGRRSQVEVDDDRIDQAERDVFHIDTRFAEESNKPEVGQISPPNPKKSKPEQPKAQAMKCYRRWKLNLGSITRSVKSTASISELLTLGKTLGRERRRVNQARYRKKQNDKLARLEKETEALRQEIESLLQPRHALSPGIKSSANIWGVAVQFFQVSNERQCTQQSPIAASSRAIVQQEFVKANMKPDVVFNAEQGVESILRRWWCFSSWFEDLEVELQDLEKDSQNSLVATTTTNFTLTSHTIRHLFPHLMGNGSSPLVVKLLDQRISLVGS